MHFSFTEEQQMLLDTTRRFIGERYGFEFRNAVRASTQGWSAETWAQLAELGLLAVNVPEEDGGIGAGPVGTMLVSNAVGEGLLLEPFLSSAVIATQAIATMGSAEQRAHWLPALAGGETIAVLAHDEPSTRGAPLQLQTRAVADGDGWRISGHKSGVYHAPAAQLLLVSARLEEGGLGVFAVPADATGLGLNAYATVDEQRAADITLDGVRLDAAARLGGEASEALQQVLDYGLAALCGEAFGAMDRILAATIDYSRSRVQFGQPIGRFQALQHRMAEMLMHLEQARSMSYLAAAECMNPDAAERRAALSAAKALMGQAARCIGQQAVQLHGGMGMTDELDVSHYFKRLLAFELRCGTTDEHLEAYRRQLQTA
ncbi:MAG TPA: acyl-CoA dehydrogenase family protein [Pseudoxanthomonas sp.]|nr:acyl-CoA dehydrogenase family protein [Pseudoxanthomonas sp.]